MHDFARDLILVSHKAMETGCATAVPGALAQLADAGFRVGLIHPGTRKDTPAILDSLRARGIFPDFAEAYADDEAAVLLASRLRPAIMIASEPSLLLGSLAPRRVLVGKVFSSPPPSSALETIEDLAQWTQAYLAPRVPRWPRKALSTSRR